MWRKAWDYLKTIHQRFQEDGGDSSAAAISFYALLSLAPLSLLAVAVLSFFIRDEATALAQLQGAVARLLPGAGGVKAAERLLKETDIPQQVANLIALRGWAAAVGIVSLVWSASRIFVNATPALNAAFNAKETRSFVRQQGVALGMLFGVGALFLLSLTFSALPSLLPRIPPLNWLPDVNDALLATLALALGVGLNALIFAVTYRFLPSPEAKVSWKQALVGGGVVAVAWEVLKQAFALYLNRFGGSDSYGKVYGSLGGVIILILWIHYSSTLLLYGAQIAQMYGERHPEETEDPEKARHDAEARTDGGGESPDARRKPPARGKN
jgi:membrane protein